ncbi:MAG: hypothetical protein HYZ15_14020 [Sphingobacteriales bacterium]|nr:hypothetical protein [Sphingobacteriales bacterium]
MVRILFVILCDWLLTKNTAAQSYYFYDDRHYQSSLVLELGTGAGIMNAFTDLGGRKGVGKKFIKDLNWKNARPCFTFYTTALYKNIVGLRLQVSLGQVSAADSILKPVKGSTSGRYERNLSFRSVIKEIILAAEIYPLSFRNYALSDKDASLFSPYLVAGIGYFSFDPQAKWKGRWYSLQPLHTEGQGFANYPDRKPYSLQQWNVAAGAGFRYELSALFNLRLEIIHRFLATDYLDDVSLDQYIDPSLFLQNLPPGEAALALHLSDRRAELDPGTSSGLPEQRGNPRNKDAYFTLQFHLGLLLGRTRR